METTRVDTFKKMGLGFAICLVLAVAFAWTLHGCDAPKAPRAQAPSPLATVIVADGRKGIAAVPAKPGVVTITQKAAPKGTDIPLPNGETVHVAPGQSATVDITQEGEFNGGSSSETDHGTAKGAGQSANGEKIDENLSSDSPELGFGDWFAKGGATKFKAKMEGSTGVTILVWAGIGLFVLGIVVWVWAKQPTLGQALIISGIAVLIIAFYPQFLIVAGILGLLALGFVLYHAWKAKQTASAATAVANGVSQGFTIGPADLHLTINAADYAQAQAIIDATIAAVNSKITAAKAAAK